MAKQDVPFLIDRQDRPVLNVLQNLLLPIRLSPSRGGEKRKNQ
jgi:hypothetical protein